jgi:hypothetical protein
MKYTPGSIVFNGILYAVFIWALIYFLGKEKEDLFSSKGINNFGDGYGKYMYKYKPKKNIRYMKENQIYNNILNLAKSNENIPKWRRSVIISVFISVFLVIILYKKMVSFSRFMIFFLVCFIFINFSFNYYYYHYEKFGIDYIKENLIKLREFDRKKDLKRENIKK